MTTYSTKLVFTAIIPCDYPAIVCVQEERIAVIVLFVYFLVAIIISKNGRNSADEFSCKYAVGYGGPQKTSCINVSLRAILNTRQHITDPNRFPVSKLFKLLWR